MCKQSTELETTQIPLQDQEPFEIVKNYRSVQLKKRRKLLRNLNLTNKIALHRRHLLNSNSQPKNHEKPLPFKKIYSPEEEFNMFF
jgi:hypothetical protein